MAKTNNARGRASHEITMIGDLPVPSVERLPIDEMLEQRDNVREEITFHTSEDIILLRSLAINGQTPGHLFVVSIRPNGDKIVLVGNRRTATIKLLRDPARFDALKKSMIPGPLKGIEAITDTKLAFVECLVYTGLNESQEAQIRADHIGVKKLSKWDRFTQVIQLLGAGLTTMQVESQTGVSHGSAERELWRYEMGEEVVANYYNQLHDKPCVNMSVDELKELHKLWNMDRDNGVTLPVSQVEDPAYLKFPNGRSNVFKKFGPLSQAGWDEHVAKDAARKAGLESGETTEKKRRTQKQHEANAEQFKGAPFTRDYARWAAGEDVDLNELYRAELAFVAEFNRMKLQIEDLVLEKMALTEEVEKLKEVIEQYEASREKKQLEYVTTGEVVS